MTETTAQKLHEALIQKLLERGELRTPAIIDAFRAVPRHHFLPGRSLEEVYDDIAVLTKVADGRPASSSSQPTMMAIMLEQLELQSGENILEIGAGTGYNAALIAHLVGPSGRVTSVDIEPDLVASAREHLAVAGVTNVYLHCGDGADGYAPHAPYDRIILTVAAPDITPAWMAQLKADGRILLPLVLQGPQISVVFDRRGEHFVSGTLSGCGFIILRGGAAVPMHTLALPELTNVTLLTFQPALAADPQRAQLMSQWLREKPVDLNIGLEVTIWSLVGDWQLWQTAQPDPAQVIDVHNSDDLVLIPFLDGANVDGKPFRVTVGIIEPGGMAFFMRPLGHTALMENDAELRRAPFPLTIRGFGPQGSAAAAKLREYVLRWDGDGRPQIKKMRIIAAPRTQSPVTLPPHRYALTLTKRWLRYQMYWPVEAE